MRQLGGNWETGVEEEQRRQHNVLLPTGRSLSSMQRPPKAGPPPRWLQQLCTHRQHSTGPGARGFNAGHIDKGPGATTSCPTVTSPSPWHLQSTEKNSFLSTHTELFFKGMSPPNGNNFLLHFQPSVLNIKRELIEHI